MMRIIRAVIALSSLYNVIYATQITCETDPSNIFYNLQFDHITTETYGGSTSYEIGWKKVLSCDEGHHTDIIHPLDTATVEGISPYAISAKIVPDNLLADPDFHYYAVYAKVCQNPIISLNNLLELSNTINITTLTRIGPTDLNDWYSLHDATSRLEQAEYCHCPDSDPLTTSPFRPCSGYEKQLQIYTKITHTGEVDVCQWDRHTHNRNGNKKMAVYFGFDAHKESMCDGGGDGGLQSVVGTRRANPTTTRRRILTGGNDTQSHSPCLTLGIRLETENLLPSNNAPDAAANVFTIGSALAGSSNGVLNMPDIVDPELLDDDNVTLTREEEEYVWDIPPGCEDSTQIQDSYFPSSIEYDSLDANIEATSDGFSIVVSYTTPASILYVFEIDFLPFTISHTCSNNFLFWAEIYEDGTLLKASESIEVPPNETGLINRTKSLPFVPSVQLAPGTIFEIRFVGIYAIPTDCEVDKISIGTGGRRRMADGYFSYADFEAKANPNSCLLGAGLAKSTDMKTAVEAMCNEDLDNRETMETGFFKQHGQNALRNHLVKSGSLEVYDENGELIFNTTDWPDEDIEKPCIAIDEDNNRVFAVGGISATTGYAVKNIQVFEFTDDSLTNGGPVTDLDGWTLDRKRYGSMCLFWRKDDDTEHLIVVSGMFNPSKEFTNKKKFFNDIKIFQVPADSDELDFWYSSYSPPQKSLYEPATETVTIAKKGLIGSRLLLFDNHMLYFFGGKTHVQSKNFVSSIDLNKLSDTNTAALETMSLNQKKAQPVIDITALNDGTVIRTCYMIFAGQSYENRAVVSDSAGLSFDYLQLFCNSQLKSGSASYDPIVVETRRLAEENVISLTEFDKSMFEKGKRNTRRLPEEEDESQVFIRDYDYRLDGIWYDFNITVEICYDDNSELQVAEDFYTDHITSADYLSDIGDTILNESRDAYFGWSDGFGAVIVHDLDIINVNYRTDSPTNSPSKYPTKYPTNYPSKYPTEYPTNYPSKYPSEYPTNYPSNHPTNGCVCVSDCSGVPDGDYPSCNSCHKFASCVSGHLFDNRPCALPSLVWDDILKRCMYESSCGNDPCNP